MEWSSSGATQLCRYLGVLFNTNNLFHSHYSHIKSKAYAVTLGLYSLFASNSLPLTHRLSIVKSVLYPAMFYAMPAWANAALTLRKRARQCFARHARKILGLRFDHSTTQLFELIGKPPTDVQITKSKRVTYTRLLTSDDNDLVQLAHNIRRAWPELTATDMEDED